MGRAKAPDYSDSVGADEAQKKDEPPGLSEDAAERGGERVGHRKNSRCAGLKIHRRAENSCRDAAHPDAGLEHREQNGDERERAADGENPEQHRLRYSGKRRRREIAEAGEVTYAALSGFGVA